MSGIKKFLYYAKKRKQSVEDYFAFQRYQGRLLIRSLQKHVPFGQPLSVLDIGSGIGGYVYELSRLPSVHIISFDKNPLPNAMQRYRNVSNPRRSFKLPFLKKAPVAYMSDTIAVVEGNATKSPFKDQSFDLIIASSVIEHVPNQEAFVRECYRMLKPNGLFYLSFPPYYSPLGGHRISPLHYIPGKFPLWLYQRMHPTDHASFKYYGLVKTTIRSIEKLVKNRFIIVDMKPRLFDFLKPFVRIPFIREFVIHHVEFFLRKK